MASPRSAALLALLGAALFAAGWLVGSRTSSAPSAGGRAATREPALPGQPGAARAPGATPSGAEDGTAPRDPDAAAPAAVPAPDPPPASAPAASAAPPAGIDRSGPVRDGPPPPYTLPEEMKGRVVDALTGAAIPGARLSLGWALSDGTISGGIDIAIGPDGAWQFATREQVREAAAGLVHGPGVPPDFHRRFETVEQALADLDFSLRATADGYESSETGDPGAESDLGLRPEHPLLPGSIRIEARWPDGVRFQGRLLVETWDDRQWHHQWVLPDAAGDHVVAGVPPGRWNVRVAGRKDSGVEVRVPEAGEVRARLPVPRSGVQELEGAPGGPTREVEVGTGAHPVAVGAFVRAESRAKAAESQATAFFRSEVEGASASFAALPAGEWTFVLQVPGRPEVRFEAEVPAAPDRLRLEFPSPK